MAGEKELSDLRPAGSRMGQSATDLVGFHGATPSDQYANVTSVGTAASITTAAHGFATGTQADAIVTAVNAILACLEEKGLMASS